MQLWISDHLVEIMVLLVIGIWLLCLALGGRRQKTNDEGARD